MSVLSRPYFHDETEAFAFVEGVVWPEGPTCPHCGTMDRIYALNGVRSLPSKKNPEGVVRHGLRKCGHCRGQFTVRMGTIFEESKLPLTKWLQTIFLMTASKKGVSAHQLHRTLEVTYKTAWFLAHRIREAMRSGELAPFGGEGGAVEVDETYLGNNPDNEPKDGKARRSGNKNCLITMIDRETGRARSIVIDKMDAAAIGAILEDNISTEARLMTDEHPLYGMFSYAFADHGRVTHSRGEYVSKQDRTVHTQTVEGFYSVFKRGVKGVYRLHG
jgi:transposase-like protein